jgi:hypothetical protein
MAGANGGLVVWIGGACALAHAVPSQNTNAHGHGWGQCPTAKAKGGAGEAQRGHAEQATTWRVPCFSTAHDKFGLWSLSCGAPTTWRVPCFSTAHDMFGGGA